MAKQNKDKIQKNEEADRNLADNYKPEDFCIKTSRAVNLKTIFICLIVTLAIGLSSGFMGGLYVLTAQRLTLPFLKTWDFSEKLPKREITIRTQENITITEDKRLEGLVNDINNQLVQIFPAKKVGKGNIINQIYLPNELVAFGFILTNDGWVVTNNKALDIDEKYILVTPDRQLRLIEKKIVDPLTNVAFLKIASSQENFSVAKLAAREEIIPGQKVLFFNDFEAVSLTNISHLKYRELKDSKSLVMSTERLQEFILLDQDFKSNFIGGPVINLSGSVVGILDEQRKVIPTNYFNSAIDQLLRYGNIKRPVLGLYYLDLSQALGIISADLDFYSHGALIYGSPRSGSSALKGGLKNADVITKVNNDLVNGRYSLTELIQEYLPGDEIEISYIRRQEEGLVKVRLGEREEPL